MRCGRTKRRITGNCDLCCRRNWAKPGLTTGFRSTLCAKFCDLLRSLWRSRSCSRRARMPETMAAPTTTPKSSDPAERPNVPPKGTKFEGAASEADAGLAVRDMFSQIAPRYDLLNHLLSMQLDRVWRRRVARRVRPILQRADARVLDLCCGTGDLAFSLRRAPGTRSQIVGADFSHAMLVRARDKGSSDSVGVLPVFEADALRMPFADASFDLVTTAFGFRNLANYEDGLREI